MSFSTYGDYTKENTQQITRLFQISVSAMSFIQCVVCSKDGKHVTYAHSNGSLINYSNTYGKTWRFSNTNENTFTYATNKPLFNGIIYKDFQDPWITSMVCSSDGRYLVAGSITGPTRIKTLDTNNTPTTRSIVYSNDYGITWQLTNTNIGSGIPNNGITSSNNCKYLVACAGSKNFQSDDYGVTWTSNTQTLSLRSVSQSLSGKFVVGCSNTTIYTSNNYGRSNSWTTNPLVLSNLSFSGQSFNAVKISGNGKKILVTILPNSDNTNSGIIISNDFGTSWSKCVNAPTGQNNPFLGVIASSENFQNLIVVETSDNRAVSSKGGIFISNDGGTSWSTALQNSNGKNWSSCRTTSSGQYVLMSDFHANGAVSASVCYYVADNYTYSYTPIKIAYNNKFNFTFNSKLYDCSGTYYLKNENNQTLSTKVMDVSYTETIVFTDISTNLFDYGNSPLFVYKQNDNALDEPGYDIQISDPMVVNATCFLEGTQILAMGSKRIVKYIPIEKLKPGMLVKTLYAGFVPIKYIGYSTLYNPGLATRVRDQLFVYKKSACPELREDLVITGNHSVLVDTITDAEREQIIETLGDIYVTDRKYRLPAFNDKRAEPYDQRGDFRIWNLALENKDYYANYGIYANGLLVETTSCRYLKEISRMTLVEKE
jgi:photosystem II stability/assembly factor-like uncharacterized protein